MTVSPARGGSAFGGKPVHSTSLPHLRSLNLAFFVKYRNMPKKPLKYKAFLLAFWIRMCYNVGSMNHGMSPSQLAREVTQDMGPLFASMIAAVVGMLIKDASMSGIGFACMLVTSIMLIQQLAGACPEDEQENRAQR